MKTLLYSTVLACLLPFFGLQAQITITAEDAPDFGNYIIQAEDTLLTSIDLGTQSANAQAWSYLDFDTDIFIENLIVDPAATPLANSFPDATFGFEIPDGQYAFAQITGDALLALGGAQPGLNGDTLAAVFEDPQQLLSDPTTYGTAFSDDFRLQLTIDGSLFNADSIRIIQNGQVEAEADAFGTLTLPFGTYETVRLRSEIITNDTISALVFGNYIPFSTPTDTIITYEWWAKDGLGAILSVTTDTEGNPLSANYLHHFSDTTQAPIADFSFELQQDTQAVFTDESSSAAVEWAWDFGDGNTSEEQNPVHTYSSTGTYTVCLTASNSQGSDQICQDVVAGAAPQAAFSFDILNDSDVQFTDQSSNQPDEWLWDFGDGSTSTEQNPTHTYAQPGIYTVCLTATNALGSNQICQEVVLGAAPQAAFGFDVLNDNEVEFTDQSSNQPNEWAWDFGDGNSSTEQNPSHTYAAPGIYTVCLTATNALGSDQICQDVTVGAAPQAAFDFNALNDSDVQFTDQSANQPNEWAWDFGDGNSSTEQNPSHTYAAPGIYTVCLTATNALGSDQSCQDVAVGGAPQAMFSFNILNDGEVQFTDQSANQPEEWLWEFGDGNSSTEQNPTHTYAEPGVYTVCLTVTNAISSDQSCQDVVIAAPPQAGFSFELLNNSEVQFTDQSSNQPEEWLWEFGDGNSSTEQNPTHTYAEPGVYTVCLTVSNTGGSTQVCQDVTVGAAPQAAFSSDVLNDSEVQFTDQSANLPDEWLWDFGDGNTSTEQNPLHTYEEIGNYTVCLTASNALGSDQICQDITVGAPPQAGFTFELLNDSEVQFTDESANQPSGWLWEFGDGNSSDEQNPTHAYAEIGVYNVCLTVTNTLGINEICQDVTIGAAPQADFSFDIMEDGEVQFSDLSANQPEEWLWDFGDGNSSTEQNPTHTYMESGMYTVCLTASNALGNDQSCADIDVTIVNAREEALMDRRVTVFPSPAQDQAEVRFRQFGNTALELRFFNLLGQPMLRQNFQQAPASYEFSVSHWPSGTYYLVATAEDGAIWSFSFSVE